MLAKERSTAVKRKAAAVEEEDSLSLVATFDHLVRASSVLMTGDSEERFLDFTTVSNKNRKRWENAELECQRLAIELTKSSQEVALLESKLEQARQMLDTEQKLRKKAEQDRDNLSRKFSEVQNLVMSDGPAQTQALQEQMSQILGPIFSPITNKGEKENLFRSVHLGNRTANRTGFTEGSVLDVDELTFDETGELCQDSPLHVTRSGTRFGLVAGRHTSTQSNLRRKSRSRSRGRTFDKHEQEQERSRGRTYDKHEQELEDEKENTIRQLEGGQEETDETTETTDSEQAATLKREQRRSSLIVEERRRRRSDIYVKSGGVQQEVIIGPETARGRRSRSAAFQRMTTPGRQRSYSLHKEHGVGAGVSGVPELPPIDSPMGHQFLQKTVLKSDKCGVCFKRMKFGKIGLRCAHCRLNIHQDCQSLAPNVCGGPILSSPVNQQANATPEVSKTMTRTPKAQGSIRKQIFASPMLR